MTPSAGSRPVGYYVHHHGAGHGTHAKALAAVLGDRLVGLGSGPPPTGWINPWIALPSDDDPLPGGDPTRNGTWHWVPDRHHGFSDRMRAVADWVGAADPSVLVSDVSVEVAVLAALLGVPSVPVMLHGHRDDRPHRLAFDTAAAIIAPWPASHLEPWHERWSATLHPVGFLSRYADRVADRVPMGERRVLVVLPAGGHEIATGAVEAAARTTARAGWCWEVAGRAAPPADSVAVWHGMVEDLWPCLERASVVVAAAGAGTVADIAAARRPAVILPQPRPFEEQVALASHLAGEAPVRVCSAWPAPSRWPDLLGEVAAFDGSAWSKLHDGAAAHRIADLLASLP